MRVPASSNDDVESAVCLFGFVGAGVLGHETKFVVFLGDRGDFGEGADAEAAGRGVGSGDALDVEVFVQCFDG